MRARGTRPSAVLSGLGSEAETGEHNGGDKSGIVEEICELIHVLYTISSVCPSPLNLCGAEDDARVTTKLIIFQNPRIGKCHALPANQPTDRNRCSRILYKCTDQHAIPRPPPEEIKL